MPDEVKISAIVSTYASEEFMAECLDDLVGQTAADQLEIVVVDACSPQGEGGIVARYQERFPRINYIRTPERIGIYAAWNVAIKAARGKYLTPFSTNDRLATDAYEVLGRYLDEHPDVDLVYGDTHLTDLPHQTFESFSPSVGDEGPAWQWPPFSYFDLLVRCSVGPHPMWRKEVHGPVGLFDESFKSVGDQDFWLRLGRAHVLRNIPHFTGLYWREEAALSNQEGAFKELARLRMSYVPAYLKSRDFGECNAIRDKVLSSFERGELAQAIIAFKCELEECLLSASCKLSEQIMLLTERGRLAQAHGLYLANRPKLPDFPELAELDALMKRVAGQLGKQQR
ncbi:putative glycosyltransferase [Desulfocurvibacter africanus PCS]|uniref:Putative glycosyltransferase n=1 Tax=Desulfocurvibacter africanus PCS TaxID=1262666 RepID=M5PU32_DESAF|nr:glycosyltransferase [Desulfocurvibacter africanus]EMG37520.1 putative glycosyltransferase [Desulfocurvibacter africanus PCS]